MSWICGVCRPDGGAAARRDVEQIMAAMERWTPDDRAAWNDDRTALGGLLLDTAPHDAPAGLLACASEARRVLVGDLRIDNRAELAARLGVGASDLATWSSARLVLRAYDAWGEGCVPNLLGDFAFAIWDADQRTVFCARDPFGVKPLYYARGADGAFAFASDLKGLVALSWLDRTIDERWVCDYLHNVSLDREATMYAAVRRLEPAHALTMGPSGLRTTRYWTPDTRREIRLADEREYVEAFLEHFRRSVDRRCASARRVGGELSGGLDSSGICVVAHRLLAATGRELHVFSEAIPPEIPAGPLRHAAWYAIDDVVREAGMGARWRNVVTDGRGVDDVLTWAARHTAAPPPWHVALFYDLVHDAAAAADVRVLLSGFGGNQGVTWLGAGREEELLFAGRWLELWNEVSAGGPRRAASGLANVLVTGLGAERLATWRGPEAVFRRKMRHAPVRDDFAARLGGRARALSLLEPAPRRASMNDRIVRAAFQPIALDRLEISDVAATVRRIEYRYPLFDRELFEFFLATPSAMKQRRGVGRYLFRESMRGLLPERVRSSVERGPAVPNTVERLHGARAIMNARLGALPRERRLFDYADTAKLAVSFTVKHRSGAKLWARNGHRLRLLLLDQALDGAGAS